MLDSKVDKQIKRFLKSKSVKTKLDKGVEGSCYYYLNNKDMIRFADHHKSLHRQVYTVQIIKYTNNTYYIEVNGVFQTVKTEEEVLACIKGIFLILNDLVKTLRYQSDQCAVYKGNYLKFEAKYNTLIGKINEENSQNKIKRLQETIDEMTSKLEASHKFVAILKGKFMDIKNKADSIQKKQQTFCDFINLLYENAF